MRILVKSSEFEKEEEVDTQANDRNACMSKSPVPSVIGNLTCSSSVCDTTKNAFYTNPEKTVFGAKQLSRRKWITLTSSAKLSDSSRLRRAVSNQC